jgi:hypothetical protein
MTPEDWARVNELFNAALELLPEERAAFIASACHGDPTVDKEVQRLLAAHDRAGEFLNTPALANGGVTTQGSEPPAVTVLERGQIFADRYVIEGELGRGGYGVVYAALDRALQRPVALKVIRLVTDQPWKPDTAGRQRILVEARLAAKLSHANIATVYDAGESGGCVYMTQELAPGRDLGKTLAEGGALPVQRSVLIARQICEGLAHAHSRKIVHRDIKPGNIVVNADDTVKITDFGIAQPLQEDDPAIDQGVVGSPGYMAPEQLRGGLVDERADVFAVGCVLYQMLTGRQPFAGSTTRTIVQDTLHADPPEPSRLRGDLPRALDRIVRRAISKNPDERYESITDLQRDLLTCEHWRRRRPATVLALALAVILVTLGGAIYFRHRFRQPALKSKPTIVLADFINRAGDPAFNDALKHGLEAALPQSPFANLISDSKVAADLRLMQPPLRASTGAEMAREVCQRAGSFAYIEGSISALGTRYVLGFRAVNCSNGEPLPEKQAIAGSKQEALNIIYREAAKLSRELGEALKSARGFDGLLGVRNPSREAPRANPPAAVDQGGRPEEDLVSPRASETRTTLDVIPARAVLGSLFMARATVRDQSGNPVTHGSVTFYDETTPLGTVQLVSHPSGSATIGTATLKTILVPLGPNRITAKYVGPDLASTSPVVVATLTGKYSTKTTFSHSGSGGNCAFKGTVDGAGPTNPTGNVGFTDTQDGLVAGTAALDAQTWTQAFEFAYKVAGFSSPEMAAVADVNGDGFPDLFTRDRNGLTVALGNGDGTFKSPMPVFSGDPTWGGSTLGDFNNDGKLDVAAAVRGHIVMLLGHGDGTFEAKGSFENGSPMILAAGDFNGDGILDLVATNKSSIDLLVGNGDGTFKAPVIYPLNAPLGVAVGDVNRDGLTDVVVATAPHDVTVYFGSKNGTLRRGPTYVTQYEPGGLLLTDLRGNGSLDLITLFTQCCEGDDTSVNVMRGNGDGTFQAEQTILSGTSYFGAAVGDFNGDGKMDLVISDYGYPFINVLLGNGDGTFQGAVPYAVGVGPIVPMVADLNHDGRPDLVVASHNDGDVRVLLNHATQTAMWNNAVVASGRRFVAAHYTGDRNFAPSTSAKTALIGNRNGRDAPPNPCSESRP